MTNNETKAFYNYHPLPLFVYFLSVLTVIMFSLNPVLLSIALLGGICFSAMLMRPKEFLRSLIFYLAVFIVISISNPLFSHKGVTVLFYAFDNPVTFESLLYGIDIAVMLIAVIYWCKCYNEIINIDKFLFLFSRIIPKMSLVLSMTLKFIPQFRRQLKTISDTQTAMGLYSKKGISNRIKNGMNIFSILVTHSFENSIETANSMKARGFGTNKRTNYNQYKFTINDVILLFLDVVLLIFTIVGISLRATDFNFYPRISQLQLSNLSVVTYIAFFILSFLPFFIEVKESIKWKYFESKI